MTENQRVADHPAFRQLCFERRCLGLTLAALLAIAYFAFIGTVAFSPARLGTPLYAGTVITWGVLVGAGLLVLGFLLTALYVLYANLRLDVLGRRLREELP